MIVIPAIDIKSGKCVRLTMGDYSREKVYSDNPVEVALNWEKKGAKFLHVVDLNGAKEGKLVNFDVVREIAQSVKIPVEYGGGIRDIKTAEHVINNGIARVVVGTSALNEEFLKGIISALNERVYVGIDSKSGFVAVKGWTEISKTTSIDFAKFVWDCGGKGIIVTNIERDGMLRGIDIDVIKEVAESVNMNVIVSGGVSSAEDLEQIKSLSKLNIEGVIIGKALYEEKIKLEDVNT